MSRRALFPGWDKNARKKNKKKVFKRSAFFNLARGGGRGQQREREKWRAGAVCVCVWGGYMNRVKI